MRLAIAALFVSAMTVVSVARADSDGAPPDASTGGGSTGGCACMAGRGSTEGAALFAALGAIGVASFVERRRVARRGASRGD